jgi:hypothetical protein
MNLYIISRQDEPDEWLEHFQSAVVVAKSTAEAREIHPSRSGDYRFDRTTNKWGPYHAYDENPNEEWVPPTQVDVQLIGQATDDMKERTVLCADYYTGG